MDGDSKKQKTEFRDNSTFMPNGCDVFQPLWVRCFIRYGNVLDQFLLDYRLNFLLPFGVIFWLVFLIS
jgi:hypothetical protein